MAMFSSRMLVSRQNCLNFSFKSSESTAERPVDDTFRVRLAFIHEKVTGVIWTNRALTVEFVQNLRNPSLGLDGVNESVLIKFGIDHTHVVVITPT